MEPNPAPDRKPIVTIDTVAPVRPLAHIDDIPHPFRLTHEFGVIERAEYERDSARFNELLGRETAGNRLTRSEVQLLEATLHRALGSVLDRHEDMREVGALLVTAVTAELGEIKVDGRAGLTKAEKKELEETLERLFDRALINPAGFREQLGDRLTGEIKRRIVVAFSNAPELMQLLALEEAASEESPDLVSTSAS